MVVSRKRGAKPEKGHSRPGSYLQFQNGYTDVGLTRAKWLATAFCSVRAMHSLLFHRQLRF